jgi:peptide methionine sulfoxide reductase MsrB
MTGQAFHGNTNMKSEYLRRVRTHKDQHEMIQEEGWNNGRGDAIGCILHGDDPSEFETTLGIPSILACVMNSIFLRLSPELAMDFPEAFLSSIQPGTDLSGVWSKTALWLLADPQEGMTKLSQFGDAVHDIADLYRNGCTDVSRWVELSQSAQRYLHRELDRASRARDAKDHVAYCEIKVSHFAYRSAYETAAAASYLLKGEAKSACRSAGRSLARAARAYLEDSGEPAYHEACKRQSIKVLEFLRTSMSASVQRVEVSCPTCGQRLRLPVGRVGCAQCPVCQRLFDADTGAH